MADSQHCVSRQTLEESVTLRVKIYTLKKTHEWDTMRLDWQELRIPLHWMGQTVLLGSSASQPQSHSCSRWAAHSAQWAFVQQPWQMRIQQVEIKPVSEAGNQTHLRFLNSPLTVHHMMSLTPVAQMPGSPGSHTTRKKLALKEMHTYSGVCLSTYITHVIMPGACDLR